MLSDSQPEAAKSHLDVDLNAGRLIFACVLRVGHADART